MHHRDAAGVRSRRLANTDGRVAIESLATELVIDRIYRSSSIELLTGGTACVRASAPIFMAG